MRHWKSRAFLTIVLAVIAVFTMAAQVDRPVSWPHGDFVMEPAHTPVVDVGRAGWPILVADPSVLKDEEGYHLFYTTLFCKKDGAWHYSWDPANPEDCSLAEVIGTTGYAFSSDRGLHWEFRPHPVILPADQGWNSGDIETPFALRFQGRLVVFYSAFGEVGGEFLEGRYQVGAAVLDLNGRTVREALMEDGDTLENLADPVLPASTSAGGYTHNVQEPSAVVVGDTLELWFIGLGLSRPDQPIDSPDQEITAIGLGRAEVDANLTEHSRTERPVVNLVNIAEVRELEGSHYLFYTTIRFNDWHHREKIAVMRSGDGGTTWTRRELLLGYDPTVPFVNWGMMAPALVEEADEYVMFFTAWGAEQHACYPVPEDGRFGMPVDDRDVCLYATLGRATAPKDRANGK